MERPAPPDSASSAEPRSALRIFGVFLALGLTSFGGPIAHLGYFRNAFVVRRKWLDEAAYADLVALCQILPGPASSQVGFAIGMRAGGLAGAFAAFAGFTLPSALIMFAAASSLGLIPEAVRAPLFHGLILVAAPIVAHAVVGMARSLCNRPQTAIIGLAALAVSLGADGGWLQPVLILAGGLAGLAAVPAAANAARPAPTRISRTLAITCLAVFAVLVVALPILAAASHAPALALADGFYRSGALVFGGGHVILPLLEAETAGRGWLAPEPFLAGYGAAQALPGPLTAFAAFLGAASNTGLDPVFASLLALIAVFAPGFLLLVGALPYWTALSRRRWMRRFAAGAGAAVVGVIAAALWRPVITSAVLSPWDAVIAAAGFAALMLRAPVWLVVVGVAAAGAYASTG